MVMFEFRELHQIHTFHIAGLAVQAGVSQEVILAMLNGKAVARTQAEAVLSAHSRRTGRRYTSDNVQVQIEQEMENR